MESVRIPIKKIVSNSGQIPGLPQNPRFVRDERFEILKESLREDPEMLDLRELIVIENPDKKEEYIVLMGNMRLKAAKELKFKDMPCKILPPDTDPKKLRAYTMKDNISYGEMDWEIINSEWDIDEITDWGVELPDFEAERGLGSGAPGGSAGDDGFVPPDLNKVKTDIVPGDIIEIGRHRLMCGSSDSSDDVEKLINGTLADIMVTDPPYGVNYTGKTKDALQIENDNLTEDQTFELWSAAVQNFLIFSKDAAPIYATVPARVLQIGFMQVMKDAGCLHQCMVWDKGQMVLGHSDYHYAHEPILYGWKPGSAHYFTNDRTKTTVFRYPKPSRSADHPTMKPPELWGEMIDNSSLPGAVVLDLFGGSGTTMVVCEQTGRSARLMELSPVYCQVIVNRLLKVNGALQVKVNGIDVTERMKILSTED